MSIFQTVHSGLYSLCNCLFFTQVPQCFIGVNNTVELCNCAIDDCNCASQFVPTTCETIYRDTCLKADDAKFQSGGELEKYTSYIDQGTCFPVEGWGDVRISLLNES